MVAMLLTCPTVLYPTAVPSRLTTSSTAETETRTSTTQEISRHVCQLGKMLYFFPGLFFIHFYLFLLIYVGLGVGVLGLGLRLGFWGWSFQLSGFLGFFGVGALYTYKSEHGK